MQTSDDEHSGNEGPHATMPGGLAAAGGVLVHFLVSVMLGVVLITAAYRFASSVPGGGEVSSADQLYKLGQSPRGGALALACIGLLSSIGTVCAAASRRTRSRAWLVPAAGILLSILAAALSIAAFVPPPPDIGG